MYILRCLVVLHGILLQLLSIAFILLLSPQGCRNPPCPVLACSYARVEALGPYLGSELDEVKKSSCAKIWDACCSQVETREELQLTHGTFVTAVNGLAGNVSPVPQEWVIRIGTAFALVAKTILVAACCLFTAHLVQPQDERVPAATSTPSSACWSTSSASGPFGSGREYQCWLSTAWSFGAPSPGGRHQHHGPGLPDDPPSGTLDLMSDDAAKLFFMSAQGRSERNEYPLRVAPAGG